MKTLDPGHLFELSTLDGEVDQRLQFVKRTGEKYPGNAEPSYPGTTTQEVLRALIKRMKYVNNQEPDDRNEEVILRLCECLVLLELRAAERNGGLWAIRQLALGAAGVGVEDVPVCEICGHIVCNAHE